jgi:AIPR protein
MIKPRGDWQDGATADLPIYLQSYDSLVQHFRAELADLTSAGKGDRFVNFVQKAVPLTDAGTGFEPPVLNPKKSHDEGVDLTAQSKDKSTILCIQSRLWVDRVDDIDQVISAFQAFVAAQQRTLVGQGRLFPDDDKTYCFMLVTLSGMANIRKLYEAREFASKPFYQQLLAEQRLDFVDGPQLLQVVRAAYRKTNEIPTTVVLNLEGPPIRKDNVAIGVISSVELQRLYGAFGDALFFENVRDFQQLTSERPGRTTPNQEIVKTIKEAPDKMLERNNGIVFKAETIDNGDSEGQLILRNGSVVNGCQTTTCVVENAEQTSYVLVKIVETSDSWDVAKAANYQNPVYEIDLELARYLRPQLVKRAAAVSSVQVRDGNGSAFQIIDDIFNRKVTFDETRLLFIGIFSRSPNNVFSSNYTDLRTDVIAKFYEEDPHAEHIFETLFELQAASENGLQEAKATFIGADYAPLFERLYGKDNLSYKCLISILALCGAIDIDISRREGDGRKEFERTKMFLDKSRFLLQNLRAEFSQCYKLAVKLWMQEVLTTEQDDAQIRQHMNRRSQTLPFTNAFRKLRIEINADDRLRDALHQGIAAVGRDVKVR